MRLIDADNLFKCETYRHHRSGGCDRPCPAGMDCTEYKRGERDRRRSQELWED